MGIGNCGLFQTCIYLNQLDQKAVIAGGGVAAALALCAIPRIGQALCNVMRVAMAVVVVYLQANPPLHAGGRDHGVSEHRWAGVHVKGHRFHQPRSVPCSR